MIGFIMEDLLGTKTITVVLIFEGAYFSVGGAKPFLIPP